MPPDTSYCTIHQLPYTLAVGCQACQRGLPGTGGTVPNAEAIRSLDGPVLTWLAFDLALGPPVRHNGIKTPHGILYVIPGDATGDLWQPHEDLAQADAVFRALRARGWQTVNNYAQGHPFVAVIQWRSQEHPRQRRYDVDYDQPGQPREAQALLLVSVLAVASDQEGAP